MVLLWDIPLHLHIWHSTLISLFTSYYQLNEIASKRRRTRKCWWNLRFPSSCQSRCQNSPLPTLPPSYFCRPLAHARHLTLFTTCARLPNNMINGSGGEMYLKFSFRSRLGGTTWRAFACCSPGELGVFVSPILPNIGIIPLTVFVSAL